MIHSLSGGVLKDNRLYDFAKVEIVDTPFVGNIFWYITNISLKPDDLVLVPVNNKTFKGKVLRIDKAVNEQFAPISVKRAKEVIKILKE